MPIVRRSLGDGNELTPEEREAAKQRIKKAASRPYVYDPDSPLLTEEKFTVQASKNLSPEQVERIKAAQKRHAAIDPECVKLTPEEFINWHPIGGISWEERARRMKDPLSLAGSISHEPQPSGSEGSPLDDYLEIEKALEDTERVYPNEWQRS